MFNFNKNMNMNEQEEILSSSLLQQSQRRKTTTRNKVFDTLPFNVDVDLSSVGFGFTAKSGEKGNLANYNLAQREEKKMLHPLLADLVTGLDNTGDINVSRPTNCLADLIYAMVFKVYYCFSSRRFNTNLQEAVSKEYINKALFRCSLSKGFRTEELSSLLTQLIELTSRPLVGIEEHFSADCTGFGTSQFQRWFSFKHGAKKSKGRAKTSEGQNTEAQEVKKMGGVSFYQRK